MSDILERLGQQANERGLAGVVEIDAYDEIKRLRADNARFIAEVAKAEERFVYIAEHLPSGWEGCTTEKELCEQIAFVDGENARLLAALQQARQVIVITCGTEPQYIKNALQRIDAAIHRSPDDQE